MYTADIKLDLTGQFSRTVPLVKVNVNHTPIKILPVDGNITLQLQTPPQAAGKCVVSLTFLNKDYSEFEKYNKDMAVMINQVTVQDYHYDFSKHSVYLPDYPEPWAQQQKDQGNVLLPEVHSNYMGWNGEWQLNLEMPVYRWIHKTVDLGWLI
jgi:hypothetical protein